MVPKPYQRPHPPVRVAVESRDTFAMTGSLGFPIFMRHQMSIPELQDLLGQYQDARRLAGFDGPNDVILQVGAYVAETEERAYNDPQASAMHRVRVIQQHLHQTGDEETYQRLQRSANVTYDELLGRLAFGTPDAVADKIRQYREGLGNYRHIHRHQPRRPDSSRQGNELAAPVRRRGHSPIPLARRWYFGRMGLEPGAVNQRVC